MTLIKFYVFAERYMLQGVFSLKFYILFENLLMVLYMILMITTNHSFIIVSEYKVLYVMKIINTGSFLYD